MNDNKIQKGNPHKLTIYQHTFPVASIKRFCNENNNVQVCRLKNQKQSFLLKPSDKLFCANRVWDQSIEKNFMKKIEDRYQEIANLVYRGILLTLSEKDYEIILDMFLLCNIRTHFNENPLLDMQLNGVSGPKFSKDEQEKYEKNGALFTVNDRFPSQFVNKLHIKLNFDYEKSKLPKNTPWGIIKAKEGEFICPDNFRYDTILPLSPKICFKLKSENLDISRIEVARLNKLAMENSKNYYFARDLDKCSF